MPSVDETEPVKRTRLSAEQRRESILQAAIEVFAATGYRAGKVSEVAARVGVSEPVVFQNFGSKSALFAAVLDRVAGDMSAEFSALAHHHHGSAAEMLADLLDPVHVQRLHAPGAHGALFADAATLTAEPDLSEHAKRAIRTIANHLAEVIRRSQASGEVRADVDADAAAWLVLSLMSAQPFRTAAMPEGEGLEDSVTALALSALADRKPRIP
jgi:AcrR family transcriptional regulator